MGGHGTFALIGVPLRDLNMKTFAKLAAAAAVAVSFLAMPAQAAGPRDLLAHASATVSTLRHDRVFGDARSNLRNNARAVLIFPSLVFRKKRSAHAKLPMVRKKFMKLFLFPR